MNQRKKIKDLNYYLEEGKKKYYKISENNDNRAMYNYLNDFNIYNIFQI